MDFHSFAIYLMAPPHMVIEVKGTLLSGSTTDMSAANCYDQLCLIILVWFHLWLLVVWYKLYLLNQL